MTKVGPETSFDKSGQAGGQVSGQAGGQAGGQAVTVKLEAIRLAELLNFCKEPRSRVEMQEFSGIKSRDYFGSNILKPLVDSGRLLRTIPDKPSSPNQKYYTAK